MLLDPGSEVLEGVPATFVSPFPSSASSLEKFRALAGGDGVFAAAQAMAWQDVTQMAMARVATAKDIGGFRQSWMPELVDIDAGIGGDIVRGIFGRPVWPASTDPKAFAGAALEAGLNLAVDAISAVPIFGGIAKAVISLGRFMHKLSQKDPAEQQLIVPWQEYSTNSDEDFVNTLLLRRLVPSVDWTEMFAPPLNPGVGWQLAKTKKGGETRSWGPFTASGSLEYTGYGFLPGSQRIADIVQIAPIASGPGWRADAVTNVGDYYPAVAQFGTAAWGWAQKLGGLGMYSIRAAEIDGRWKEYWESYFADGFAAIASQKDKLSLAARDIAKALLKFIVVRLPDGTKQIGFPDDWIRSAVNVGAFMTPDLWEESPFDPPHKLSSPYTSIIAPALSRLRKRQRAALSSTLACAYVRPEPVGALPAHAAFLDRGPPLDPSFPTWGMELADRCRRMREILLAHDARYDVDLEDARQVDPAFAAQLAQSRGKVGSVRLSAGAQAMLDQATPRAPTAEPPQGGAPFDDSRPRSSARRTGSKLLVVGGVLTLGYGAFRLWRKRA